MSNIAATASFVQARQKAWDGYADARAKTLGRPTPGLPRHAGFLSGFEYGALFGFDAAKAQHGEAVLVAKSQTAPTIGKRAGKVSDLILVDLRTNGPATAERIAERIGVRLNSVSPRFAKLRTLGLVRIVRGEVGSRANKAVYASVHVGL